MHTYTQVIYVNTRDNMNTKYFDLLRALSSLWGQIANQNKQKLIFQGQITILIQDIPTWTLIQKRDVKRNFWRDI